MCMYMFMRRQVATLRAQLPVVATSTAPLEPTPLCVLVLVAAAPQGPAALVPEPATDVRAVVEVAAAAHERCELALPDGVAALVAVYPQTVAADLRVRLVALAFFVHAPEARRHGIVVQGCPQGCEGGEH